MSVGVVFGKLLESFSINAALFFVTLVLALPLGLVVAFGGMTRFTPLRGLTKVLVWIVRGTPLMLQVIIIYYGPGLILGTNIWGSGTTGRLIAAGFAFVLNYSCYFGEIYRGGIQGVPGGQSEAGQVLGMTRPQIFFKVTLLQMIKRIVPPMGNEFMTLIKDTALANIISNKEIVMMSKEFINKSIIWPLFATGLFFLVFCGALTLLFNYLEKKLDYFRA